MRRRLKAYRERYVKEEPQCKQKHCHVNFALHGNFIAHSENASFFHFVIELAFAVRVFVYSLIAAAVAAAIYFP